MTDTILIDVTSLRTRARFRGMGRYLRELLSGLARVSGDAHGGPRLVALTDLSLDGSCSLSEDLTDLELPLSTLCPEVTHTRWAYARRIALARAVCRIRPDVVHLGDPHATPLGRGLTRARWITTCHDLIAVRHPEVYMGWRDGGARIGTAIERRRYATADLVVAISEATRRDLCERLALPRARVMCVHNGVDLGRWSDAARGDVEAARRKHHLDGQPYALYVGGADPHKNIDGLFRGIHVARSRMPGLKLAWAARFGEAEEARLRARATDRGLGGALALIGHVPDDELALLYRGALAHVLVSTFEGFGFTAVEAMAASCPVVTTGCGSLDELVGDAALRVRPDTPADIADALCALAERPSLGASLVAAGVAQASRFSRETQARGMLRAYQAAIALRR